MLRRILAALATVGALIIGSLVAATPAAAAESTWCDDAGTGICYIVLSTPPTDPAPNPDANGWTPGAPYCYRTAGSNPDGQ